jgi:hypothetical protein
MGACRLLLEEGLFPLEACYLLKKARVFPDEAEVYQRKPLVARVERGGILFGEHEI